jgi:hypothetical protein
MTRQAQVRYCELEEAILLHLLFNANPPFSQTTYTLVGALRPQELNSSGLFIYEEKAAIHKAEVQSALDLLFAKNLVKGDPKGDEKAFHYTKLHLKDKGKREAVRLKIEREAAEVRPTPPKTS